MTDIKLNDAGDIDLTNGKTTLVTGIDAQAQRLKIRLRASSH